MTVAQRSYFNGNPVGAPASGVSAGEREAKSRTGLARWEAEVVRVRNRRRRRARQERRIAYAVYISDNESITVRQAHTAPPWRSCH